MEKLAIDGGKPVFGTKTIRDYFPSWPIPFGENLGGMLDLVVNDRSLEIRETVLMAQQGGIRLGARMQLGTADMGETEDLVEKLFIVGDAAAALARSHQFGQLERETADLAMAADADAFLAGTVRMGTVFDHEQIVTFGDFGDAGHVRQRRVNVNRDHRFGTRGDRSFECGRIHAHRFRIDVHNHRSRADIQRGFRRGQPGDVRHDHFIAGADPQRQPRAFQRGRAVAHPDGIFRALVFRALVFREFGHEHFFILVAHAPFAGIEDLDQFFLGFRIRDGPAREIVPDGFGSEYRRAAVNS